MTNKENVLNSNYWSLSEKDVGSTAYQVANLALRIKNISNHLSNNNVKDVSAKRALLKIVARRRRYENYLSKKKYPRLKELKIWIKNI